MARKLIILAALAAASTSLVTAAPATAAQTRATTAKITKVSPLDATIGRTLYIRGRNLNVGRRRPVVVFQRADGRSVFQVVRRAGRTKLSVQVPSRLRALLATGEGGATQPTVFRLRVLARRAGPLTRAALSPRIGLPAGDVPPAADQVLSDCDDDGANDRDDADDDNDFLADAVEDTLRMNACAIDSDGDGLEDGWEYWSAKDLNARATPYPGVRPHPNALDPSDAGKDFDGDSLSSAEEHRAWRATGRILDHGRRFSPLGYSDGTQTSDPSTPPAQPAFRSASYGIPFDPPPYPATLDLDGDGRWQDDERDADADGLTNYDEAHGRGLASWWTKTLAKLDVPAWPKEHNGEYYGSFTYHPIQDTSMTEADSDGDTLLDAEDDQDHDDFANIDEILPWSSAGAAYPIGDPAGTPNAFNPCAPNPSSRTCPRHPPAE